MSQVNTGKKQVLIQYTISFVIAVVICAAVALYELQSYGNTPVNRIRFLCDGFFVSAVLFMGFGVMLWISQAGGFHAFSYLLYSVRYTFTPVKAHFEDRKSYYEYKLEKESRRSDNKLRWRLLLVGTVCLLVSLLLLAVFEFQ